MCPHRTSAAARVARNWLIRLNAKVAELADAPDLGSGGATHEGSNPSFRTSPPLSASIGRRGASGQPRGEDLGHPLQEILILVVEGAIALDRDFDGTHDLPGRADRHDK